MSVPRVFVSSTYYDLKYIRSSLELFISSLGYDAVLSEKGEIAYTPDVPLDESCYREVQNSDMYVLIIGGRYGSQASQDKTNTPPAFYQLFESVTKLEYKAAVEKDIPIYVMIERNVYAEYQTYKANRDNEKIKYVHVDSINVFRFIDEILAQPRNNPYHQFDKYSDIEDWLRLQWAGVFRELLHRRSGQSQLASLAAQVDNLAQVNITFRRYLEKVIQEVSPTQSAAIIDEGRDRLDEAELNAKLRSNDLIEYLMRRFNISLDDLRAAINLTDTIEQFVNSLISADEESPGQPTVDRNRIYRIFESDEGAAVRDLNLLRHVLGLPPYPTRTASELEDWQARTRDSFNIGKHSTLVDGARSRRVKE